MLTEVRSSPDDKIIENPNPPFPSPSKRSTKWLPINPAPPVTKSNIGFPPCYRRLPSIEPRVLSTRDAAKSSKINHLKFAWTRWGGRLISLQIQLLKEATCDLECDGLRCEVVASVTELSWPDQI